MKFYIKMKFIFYNEEIPLISILSLILYKILYKNEY